MGARADRERARGVGSRLLPLLPVAAVGAQAAAYLPRLPERMATHFGLDGRPDGWLESGLAFLVFALFVAGLPLLFRAILALARFFPARLVNIPHRDHWLAPERRASTFERIAASLAPFSLATQVFFVALLQLVIAANLSETPRLEALPFLTLLGLYLFFTAVWVVGFYRRFRLPAGEEEDEEAAGSAKGARPPGS